MDNKYEMYSNDVNYTEWFEEFKEHCECNNIDYTQYDEYSDAFHDWVYDTISMYWDDMMANIKYDKDNNVGCVVVGTLGLWDGKHKIDAKYFPTLEKAIYACVTDSDYVTIYNNNGVIEVIGVHHDGCNCLKIHKLNDKGYDAYCDDEEFDKEEYFDKFNFNW